MELISKPSKVRALGNVLEKRLVDEYLTNHSIVDLSSEEEDVPYTVVVMGNAGSPVSITASVPELKQGVSSNAVFTMKEDETDNPCVGATLRLLINGTLTDTQITNNDGQCTFSIPTTNFGSLELKCEFLGNADYSKKSFVTNNVVLRRVNYKQEWVIVQRVGTSNIYQYQVTCKSNDTNEPIDGVNVKVNITDELSLLVTGSDGIAKDSQLYGNIHPDVIFRSISKQDHYFVEVN